MKTESGLEPGLSIDLSGTKRWHINGELHKVDEPAVVYTNGTKMWFQHGILHRENGPAVERLNGSNSWYLFNRFYTEKEFKIEMGKTGLEKELFVV